MQDPSRRVSAPELVAPAGGWPQLRAALRFGADAVYLGLAEYGMRAHAQNFTLEELGEVACLAHAHGAKVYLTLNIFARDGDLVPMAEAARAAQAAGVDAAIVADAGALRAIGRAAPDLPLHLSTQANVLNAEAATFWFEHGARRIVLARELSLNEVAAIRAATPAGLGLEAFAHGSVCMAYSGRCALSVALTGRDANRGDCAQPCRSRYRVVDAERDGREIEIGEDARGAHFFSAGDLNMLPYLGDMAAAGIDAVKIEGRMKNAYYVATVVGAYRRALDALPDPPPGLIDALLGELDKAGHRPYDTGFYFGAPARPGGFGRTIQTMELKAVVLHWAAGVATVELRAALAQGDRLELMGPGGPRAFVIEEMRMPGGERVNRFARPMATVEIGLPFPAEPGDMLRGTCTNHPTAE